MITTRVGILVLAILMLIEIVAPLAHAGFSGGIPEGVILSSLEGETLYAYKLSTVKPSIIARAVLHLVSNESDPTMEAVRRTIWVNGSAFYLYKGATREVNYTLIVTGFGDFLLEARARPGFTLSCPSQPDMERAFKPLLGERARIVLPPNSIIIEAVTPVQGTCHNETYTREFVPLGENRTFIVEIDGLPLMPPTSVECSGRTGDGYKRLSARGFVPPIIEATVVRVNLTREFLLQALRAAASQGLPGEPEELVVRSRCFSGEKGLITPHLVLAPVAPVRGASPPLVELSLAPEGVGIVASGGIESLRWGCFSHRRVNWVQVQGDVYASIGRESIKWKYRAYEVTFMGALAAAVVAVLVILARRL